MYEHCNKFDNFHNLASQIFPWVSHYVLNEHYSEHFTDFFLIRKSILEKMEPKQMRYTEGKNA